ncbi:acyl-CoA dehydrogenase family protein [Noviherbaspirillum saxi]|uniref:Pimeloyl-CoA dehydrogenase large subunit n=1 Tax=Noviherbaspirillum saxi TaxID=2320863 RepID=A0A3A3FZH9_9BURK|nr:acyl-CoA dehydrogenase family protein [Noviherbaspirillum saxi]RJF92489.1 pimeloyl-CoA dehydrogenase large subunit [Noviherbaspirillum saxi]
MEQQNDSDLSDLPSFRAEVREFLANNLPSDLRKKVLEHKRLEKEDYLRWHKILFEKGWVAPNWPVEYGGTGWSLMQRYAFDEECAIAGAPETVPFGLRMVAPVIMAYGSAEQKSYYLPRILSGEDWWCQGYSEPGSGSDLVSLKMRAEIQDGVFVVNGQKTWTTYAQYADMMFCLVRTDPEARLYAGISFLLVDMRTPGISIRPIRTLDGNTEINEVFFDNVKVPLVNLVGELNSGWTYAKFLLSHERFGAVRVGRNKRELAFLKRIARERTVDGRPLVDDPVWAHAIAKLEVDMLALEQTNLRLMERVQAGAGNGAEASLLKLLGTSHVKAITEHQVEAAGTHALPFRPEAFSLAEPAQDQLSPHWSGPLVGFCLNLRKISIYGGTDEIQKNIISKVALGL